MTFALDADELSRPLRYAELALGKQGVVIDPPLHLSAGWFFTNPTLDPEAFARLEQRVRARLGGDVTLASWPEPDVRVKASSEWLIERAHFAKGRGDPKTIAISGSTRARSPTAARGRPRS